MQTSNIVVILIGVLAVTGAAYLDRTAVALAAYFARTRRVTRPVEVWSTRDPGTTFVR